MNKLKDMELEQEIHFKLLISNSVEKIKKASRFI